MITQEESTLATVGAAAIAAGATSTQLADIVAQANTDATDDPIDVQPWNGGESIFLAAARGLSNTFGGELDSIRVSFAAIFHDVIGNDQLAQEYYTDATRMALGGPTGGHGFRWG